IPRRARNVPAAAASPRDCAALRSCAGASAGGPSGSRRTGPPSWSTAIRSGGFPPARAAAWRRAASERTPASPEMFAPKRITPPTSPRLIRARSAALGVVPAKPVMIVWPTSRETSAARAAPGVAHATAATAIATTALRRDVHLAADEDARDAEVVVEHDDVGG